MIRLRDIPMPPEHNAHQLQFEAARLLRVSNSKIRKLIINKLAWTVIPLKAN